MKGPMCLLTASLPLAIAVGAIWGELVESSIKREFEAKGPDTWLPGFGGLLDRIDSLMIVAPITIYFLRFTGSKSLVRLDAPRGQTARGV